MIPIGPDMLAQDHDGGWTTLIYVLVVVVLPMLSRLGAKIRKRFGGDDDQESKTPTPQTPPQHQPKRRATKPDRRRPVARPKALRTAKPTLTTPIPQARPSRPPPPVAPPPPARPIERQRRPRPAVADSAVPRPLQAHMAARIAEKTDVPRRGTEKERKQRAAKKARFAPPSAKASPAKLLVPEVITAGDLRAAVILSEILRPPLALREPNES